MVVIGESNAFGMGASDSRNEWVQVLANLIRDFQDEPLQVLNNAIPANVISPRSPGYASFGKKARPSALERFDHDLIAFQPDLAIIAYGLNDSRCGYLAEGFLSDLETIVAEVCQRTKALVLLVGPYWNTQFDEDLWKALSPKPDFGAFSRTGKDLVCSYIKGMRTLAEKYDCLFVDLFTPVEGCTWLLSDHCHFNDVGHRVLGYILFSSLAAHCSFVGKKSQRLTKEGRFDISNTGGTDGMSRMIKEWLER